MYLLRKNYDLIIESHFGIESVLKGDRVWGNSNIYGEQIGIKIATKQSNIKRTNL